MWQEEQALVLTDEVDSVVASLSRFGGLYDIVKEGIRQTKHASVDGTAHGKPWPLLPLMVCESVSGRYERAIPAAASLALLKAAADVFDDIEDADSADSLAAKYGAALSANAATTLVILAERAVARLKDRGVEDAIIVRVFDVVNSYYTTACAGQHLDLSVPAGQIISESDYFSVSGMKSATSTQCACHVGALLGGANEKLIDTFSRFGYNLGMASQIANDIEGITRGRDIAKRKMTLPVIYAFSQADTATKRRLEDAFAGGSVDVTGSPEIQRILFSCGSIHYTSVVMEAYRQEALSSLSAVEGTAHSVLPLKRFADVIGDDEQQPR